MGDGVHRDLDLREDLTDAGSACSSTGSGGFTEHDVVSPKVRVGPHLHPISGGTNVSQLYRSFFYELLYVAPGEPVTGTCVSHGQPSAYIRGFEIFIAGGFRDTPAYGMRLLEPDGKTINQLWTVDRTDIDLLLTSEQIP